MAPHSSVKNINYISVNIFFNNVTIFDNNEETFPSKHIPITMKSDITKVQRFNDYNCKSADRMIISLPFSISLYFWLFIFVDDKF